MNEKQRKALKLALEALTATMSTHGFKDAIDEVHDKAITALKEALAQDALQALHDENKSLGLYEQEQESDDLTLAYMAGLRRGKGLAPQRTWVGLTDEEKFEVADISDCFEDVVDAVEAKLKEKNT